MNDVADRFVVLLDANVLYPFVARDVLLRFAEAGLFRARWSPQIIDEWTRSLIENRPDLEQSIRSQEQAIAEAFPEAMVVGYEHLVPALKLPDEDDRHVLAAAIRAGAQHIVTENLGDFPDELLEPYDIQAVTADQFLASTFELYPKEAMAALKKMRQAYERPPMNPSRFLMSLLRAGLGRTAALARKDIDFL